MINPGVNSGLLRRPMGGSKTHCGGVWDPNRMFAGLVDHFSPLQKVRLGMHPCLPVSLRGPVLCKEETKKVVTMPEDNDKLAKLFPATWGQPVVQLEPNPDQLAWSKHTPLRIGIVLSGGQAPGGHNVIAGVYDYVKSCNPNSQLFGFLMGPVGIYTHDYIEITDSLMDEYRNQGGFDMIRSGRHKIETLEQKKMSVMVVKKLDLQGLVVVGGDDSNTNAAVLAEFFKSNECSTRVIGVPKTIDGDLRNEYVETSFGFDTACRTYSEFIGNLCMDVATSGKYYHFVRLMGRAASNITLECALQTRPNLTFIGEEVLAKNQTLQDIVDEVVDLIVKRWQLGLDFGVILVPEGLIEFIPEIGTLIQEINKIVVDSMFDEKLLSAHSYAVFKSLPQAIRSQLLLDRDPHGNVQVSRIATERLLILMVEDKLRNMEDGRDVPFRPQSHFFGYEGRSGLPSNFDSNYCYALGHCAAALVDCGRSGYMAVVRDLCKPATDWKAAGCPLTLMMNIENRKGKDVPVIKKYLVDLKSPLFKLFQEVREHWKTECLYRVPGPIQFEGPASDAVNYSVSNPSKEQLLPEREFGFATVKSRHRVVISESQMSDLQRARLTAPVDVPLVLKSPDGRLEAGRRFVFTDYQVQTAVVRSFPAQLRKHHSAAFNAVDITEVTTDVPTMNSSDRTLRVGVVLNGQQSPGVSNVICGLWERLVFDQSLNKLLGFRKGAEGLLSAVPDYIELSRQDISLIRNQGGCPLLGREKESEMLIATDEGLAAAMKTCKDLKLDGLVLIGGRYTITNVSVVTEYFLNHGVKTKVLGVPASQNNNIDHTLIEASIGFDSASKCYSHLIGNLLIDDASCAKYWFFVRLMGADKSQMAVEAALSTHPNVVLVSEKYAAGDKTLHDVVSDIADVVCARAEMKLQFGTVVIPEGLISALPQFRQLLGELKGLLSHEKNKDAMVEKLVTLENLEECGLSPWSSALFQTLPMYFRRQLVQPRTLGSLELTKIETEELVAELVGRELNKRKTEGKYSGSFTPICFYFGYQGRSSLPSVFDCSLGMAHGYLAAMALNYDATGYITSLRGLCAPPSEWKPSLVPATAFLRVQTEQDLYPQKVPCVPSDMTRLNGKVFQKLLAASAQWEREDHFCNPGPIQFQGPAANLTNRTLYEQHFDYLQSLAEVRDCISSIRSMCSSGASEMVLQTSVATLSMLKKLYEEESKNVK